MKDFRSLQVWNKAHALTLNCYKATSAFPKSETYGITSQIRRSAASVAANIAEGGGKRGNGDFQRFLGIAADRRAKWNTTSYWRETLDSSPAINTGRALDSAVVENKRMLASLIIKVESDRRAS